MLAAAGLGDGCARVSEHVKQGVDDARLGQAGQGRIGDLLPNIDFYGLARRIGEHYDVVLRSDEALLF